MQNKIKIVKLFDKFRERVIYEVLIKIIVGKEARFNMSEIRFNTNRANPNRANHGSHTYTPRLDTIKSMKAAIRNNMAIARLEHPKDLPLIMQAAIDTHTQFQPTRDPGEARSLMFAERDRTGYQFPEQLDKRTKGIIKAGGAVIVLADKSGESGLSDFWQRYYELKDQSSSESLEA